MHLYIRYENDNIKKYKKHLGFNLVWDIFY